MNGREVTPSLYEDAAGSSAPSLECWRLGREIFRLMGGWLPLVEDRHLTEFFPYYVCAADGGSTRFGGGPLDFAERLRVRQRLEKEHADLASGGVPPNGLNAYHGEDMHNVLSWLRGEGEGAHVVNVANRGSCPDLKSGAVLEVPARLSRDAVCPVSIPAGTLAPHVAAILDTLSVIHSYSVQAAVSGDRDKAKQALLLDPFLQNRDVLRLVPELVEGLFRINRAYLPT
jgi:alpha-galactosidase/6-phospho-beta-glucosidase family protein